MSTRAARMVWLTAIAVTALLILLYGTGCQHPAPTRIALPSTLPVKRAVAVAAAHTAAAVSSNARAIVIAQQAEQNGIVAGSRDAEDLATDVHTTAIELETVTLQLGAANGTIDALTAQLVTAQKSFDAQAARLDYLEPKYEQAVKTIWWYRLRCWGLLLVSALILAVVLVAKFSRWGTATLGPYLVDAEHLAAKAAPLVALA